MPYTIGLDFGTLSVRAVVVNVADGNIVASSVSTYKHKVMDQFLKKESIPLPMDYALQDANDYIEALNEVVPNVIKESGLEQTDIIGLGIDFTSSTILPIDKHGSPLSNDDRFQDNPHAYCKLWKHHGAEKYAKVISDMAIKMNTKWISRYGNKISSEWMLPKVYETLDLAEEVFEETSYFIEAGDFITYYLTGKMIRSSCQAGYKDIWHFQDGYPSSEYLRTLDPRLTNIYQTKLSGDVWPIGKSQGKLKLELAQKFGLNEIEIGVAVIDAHVAAPACDATKDGDMLMIIGTSSCDIVLSENEYGIQGISGIVKDGAIPNLFAYESGQPAVGDIFSWYIEKHLPKSYVDEANALKQNVYAFMEEKIHSIPEDKPRLLALDWWNGNRSILVDPELTGLIVGYTLQSTPEDIYRALIEATAFGKLKTIETYENNGIKIKRLIACGGLATKNKFLLQTYANVFDKPVYYTKEEFAPALGAAIFGALAAGKSNGGYDEMNNASKHMSHLEKDPILPDHKFDYKNLYQMYLELHDYFGLNSSLMKQLKKNK